MLSISNFLIHGWGEKEGVRKEIPLIPKYPSIFPDWIGTFPITAIYGRMALFVRLVVELTINLYGV